MSLQEQLAQQQAALLGGFKKQPAQTDLIQGMSVPVSLNRNGGKLRVYIHLSSSVLESPETLNAVLDNIEQSFDLDVWQPKESQSSGGFKQSSGNYQNNNYRNNYQKRW